MENNHMESQKIELTQKELSLISDSLEFHHEGLDTEQSQDMRAYADALMVLKAKIDEQYMLDVPF